MSEQTNIIHECYEERLKNCCYNRIHYFINEEKKVIVCKIEPYPTQLHCCDCRLGFAQSLNRGFVEYCLDTNLSFTGKAVCVEPDVFNVDFGKKMAYDKAIIKLFDAKRKFFECVNNELLEQSDIIEKEIEKNEQHKQRAIERFNAKMEAVK